MVIGHFNGEYVHRYQPAKFAAIEARWQTQQPASEVLFAWPDEQTRSNLLSVSIPKLGSFIASGDWDARETGLDAIPQQDWPPVAIPFLSFRVMVGAGLLMLAVAWIGVVLELLGRLEKTRWFLWATFLSFPLGFIAVICGWFTAEVGRQPWVVYGLLRTSEAVTPSLQGGTVVFSLLAYIVVYAVVYSFGFIYIIRLLRSRADVPPATCAASLPASERRPS